MKPQAIRLVKILAGIAVVVLVIHTALLVFSGIALRNARAELRAAGRPMSPAEIIPADVPANENAAPLYESAFALLDSESIGDKKLAVFVTDAGRDYAVDPDADEKRSTFENALANETFVRTLELVEQAAARTQCNFNLQYDLGGMLCVHHVDDMLAIGRILKAKALLHARRGETQKTYAALDIALRMAEALRDEPMLSSAVVRNAQYYMALELLPALCAKAPPDDETAARLSALLADVDLVASYIRAVDGERLFMGEWTYNCFADGNVHDFLGPENDGVWAARVAKGLLGYRPSLQLDHAAYLRTHSRFAANAARPLWLWEIKPIARPDDEFPWYATISRIITPALNSSLLHSVHVQALIRVSRTGLALLRHKLAHGAYPASLAEIDPEFLGEIPVDPFTGQPLVYRPEADGFVLYSLGKNFRDDNGTIESIDSRRSDTCDIVWRSSN